jgi:hypothetical protein
VPASSLIRIHGGKVDGYYAVLAPSGKQLGDLQITVSFVSPGGEIPSTTSADGAPVENTPRESHGAGVADVFTELPTKEDLLGRFNHIQNKTQTILSGPSGVPGHPPDRERLRRGTYVVDDDFYVQHGGAPVPTKSAVATDDGDSSGAFENGPQTLRADGRDLTRPAPPTWQPSGRSDQSGRSSRDAYCTGGEAS